MGRNPKKKLSQSEYVRLFLDLLCDLLYDLGLPLSFNKVVIFTLWSNQRLRSWCCVQQSNQPHPHTLTLLQSKSSSVLIIRKIPIGLL